LRRRLELIELVSALLKTNTTLAPQASRYDLADSLASLIDEMHGEGVSAETVAGLDVEKHSAYWEKSQKFLTIAQNYLSQSETQPDSEARQRQLVTAIIQHWEKSPPQNPIILAGSTGSRGTTALLMEAVAKLPQGAVILPGFDFDMPTAVWAALDKAMLSEDHPQYRFHRLMQSLDLPRQAITPWVDNAPYAPARNKLISLSLRPAPVTHAWLSEGPDLGDLPQATQDLTLLQAPSPRAEALTIAMRMRHAVEKGQKIALITPDRMLTRQVSAALDRWDILPDDSAGMPLHLSPPGRFLRHVMGVMKQRLDAESLLTLLKHPLTHSDSARNDHQLNTQRLEMQIRKDGLPYPDAEGLARIGERALQNIKEGEDFSSWLAWVIRNFSAQPETGPRPLAEWVSIHLDRATTLAKGRNEAQSGALWDMKAGREALKVMETLSENAGLGGEMTASEYADLCGALLAAGEVRDRDAPHPDVMIWGTLEARVQGADVIILGGLNDGTWPEAPKPDPWLNRQMRADAGLLLPERRIGLSAHDYQQAIAAKEVWLTRAIRSEEAETIPSRWLNRLGNLMGGLPDQQGPQAWDAMIARGDEWLDQLRALEEVTPVDLAKRPSPRPPVAARPRGLSVTEIKKLIRDPYAIYAKHVLGLKPLNPLVQSPDAPTRGIIVHEIMERFVKSLKDKPDLLTKPHLLEITRDVLAEEVPWPAAQAMWFARIARVADWFIAAEEQRQASAEPVAFEKGAQGKIRFDDLAFELRGFADRIDRNARGEALIYDYKTGTPPSMKEQQQFDKQLILEAAMVAEGGFKEVGPADVAGATFIGLGSTPVEMPAPLDENPPEKVLEDLHSLIAAYLTQTQGFTARRMVARDSFEGDYDQLARFGEWDGTDTAEGEDLT
jgi:double-strand break repair protein AddB